MKLAFTVEYDGANFSGFQNQKNAPSIQQAIEKALKEITQTNISINYAGRTDAGVHALCQVFDFETDIERDDTNWVKGINANLPESIAIKSIARVSDYFHSRYTAKERSYSYVIYNSKSKPLFFGGHCHWDSNTIDIDILKKHADMFLGEHDFSSFRSSKCNSNNPVKNISSIEVETYEQFIIVSVKANAFLHNMVRIMTGTLIDIAKGENDYSVADILLKKDRIFAGKTAAAKGLFFLGPRYNSEENISSPVSNLFDRLRI
ncbi:tRNA pseudouridine(38-40) synthase TruA [Gammaproteobacteria bacterium]|nr:tRNA pseudouridine(38-40) synthase TruA [Gammaproteobacteria bacterium]